MLLKLKGNYINILLFLGLSCLVFYVIYTYMVRDDNPIDVAVIQEAERLYLHKDFKGSIALFEEQYEHLSPANKITLSDAYYKTGDTQRAIYILDILHDSGDVGDTYLTRFFQIAAGREVLLKNYDLATTYYKRALELSKTGGYQEDVEREFAIHLLENSDGVSDEEMELVSNLMTSDFTLKSNPDTLSKYGLFLYRSGNYASAIEVWSDVVRKHPRHTATLEQLSMIYFNLEDLDKAMYYSEQVLKFEPRNWKALLTKAEYAYNKKEYHDAKRLFLEVLSVNKTHAYSKVFLAKTLIELGGSLEAVSYLQQVLDESPDSPLIPEVKELLKKHGRHKL